MIAELSVYFFSITLRAGQRNVSAVECYSRFFLSRVFIFVMQIAN